MRMNGYWKSLLVSVIVVTMPNPRAVPQSAADTATLRAATARNDLIQSFQAENKRGTSIFYTQAYRLHGRRVEFHGSIFGEILEVQVDGCELKIKSQLVDLYSGSIGAELVGQTQNRYTTSVDFPLTPKMAADLKIVAARPIVQLSEGTNAVCSGGRQCSLTWLKVVSDRRVIHLTEITNDVAGYEGDIKDFDGSVAQFFLPVSSVDAGEEIIARMRTFAQSCAH